MTALTKGQNGPLTTGELTIAITTAAPADLSALLVTEAGKVRSDADFVFFNQPSAPGVRLQADGLAVTLSQIPADISQIRAIITLESGTFGAAAPPSAQLTDATGTVLYSYVIAGLNDESIVIAIELYRRQDTWKVRAVGQGYAGGFAALVTDHGVTVSDDEPAVTAAPPDEVRTVAGEARLSLDKRQQLDLRKRQVVNVLKNKGISQGLRARVILVIDKTLSMSALYQNKTVHRVVERMVPVANQLDDDGNLEAYMYAVTYAQLPDITVAEADTWAEQYLHLKGTHGGIDLGAIGGYNDEIPIMNAIIDSLRPGTIPALVLFFTDGGFSKKRQIKELMTKAAALPAFWQFVGLGRSSFGLLRQLDELDGRVVDNCGFFQVPDIDQVDDKQLYQLLLSEFPDWLRAAQAAGIVQ